MQIILAFLRERKAQRARWEAIRLDDFRGEHLPTRNHAYEDTRFTNGYRQTIQSPAVFGSTTLDAAGGLHRWFSFNARMARFQ